MSKWDGDSIKEIGAVRLDPVPTPGKEVFFAVVTVAMLAMASSRAPGAFNFLHLQTPGMKLSIQVFATLCMGLSSMYASLRFWRARLLCRIIASYTAHTAALTTRHSEAKRSPRTPQNIKVLMDYESDMRALKRHYAHALDPYKTNQTAKVIAGVLFAVGLVLQLASAG